MISPSIMCSVNNISPSKSGLAKVKTELENESNVESI